MAITYKYSDVLNIVSPTVSRNVEDATAAYACNIVTNEIWKRYDWRVSLGTLPPFYLTPYKQDYGAPAVAVPTDFMGLRQVFFMNYASTPASYYPLTVVKDLELTSRYALPRNISYQPDTQSFRVHPRTPAGIGAPYYLIGGTYKKLPTKVTPTTLSSLALPFDDIYLNVWVEGLKWVFWTINGDPRSGAVSAQGGSVAMQGQRAVFEQAIIEMATNEGLEAGDIAIAPSEGLGFNNLGYYPYGVGGFIY